MAVHDDPTGTLASRLRELRTNGWPGVQVTQGHLAAAFGVSVPSISSWENGDTTPPAHRLDAYARFFATRRSMEGGPHLLDLAALDEDELAAHDRLVEELSRRRAGPGGSERPDGATARTAPPGESYWHFSDGAPVTIVCAQFPERVHGNESYTRPDSPDFVELSNYADIDALIEAFGHIRAANPTSLVTFRLAPNVNREHLTTHLVLLGGVDWNKWTREVLGTLNVPVTQTTRPTEREKGRFVIGGDDTRVFEPTLQVTDGEQTLLEDIAHFVRGPNPYNQRRTVTLCNGMYARGVYGAVRALTDAGFRDRNARYIRSRFAPGDTFSILARVRVVAGEVLTPDWTLPGTVLHEWPEAGE